mmetsp:Transcript_23981/g.38464  ORF Transcript_23981/g.38464 Transcript_23981/m.38464 type:complete len:98 (-) Transcript_23981:352-645(-)
MVYTEATWRYRSRGRGQENSVLSQALSTSLKPKARSIEMLLVASLIRRVRSMRLCSRSASVIMSQILKYVWDGEGGAGGRQVAGVLMNFGSLEIHLV